MNSISPASVTEFNLEGQFVAFVVDNGKVKHLRMSVNDNELQIKLTKQARASLYQTLERSPIRPLDTIRVCGESKCDRQTGECKLKAYCVEWVETTLTVGSSSVPTKKTQPKLKLLVCAKSGCQKRGGKQQHRLIKRLLSDRNLNHVTIEETGCLGKCSMAPNIMLMPAKKRLSGMRPEAMADLVEKMSGDRA